MMRANKRRGLHKLECGCNHGLYASWAQLERFGSCLPACGVCGETFYPEDLELAGALGLEDCPVFAEYRRVLSSVMHGQARVGRGTGKDYDAERVAAARVERARVERMRDNRINALKPAPEPIPF